MSNARMLMVRDLDILIACPGVTAEDLIRIFIEDADVKKVLDFHTLPYEAKRAISRILDYTLKDIEKKADIFNLLQNSNDSMPVCTEEKAPETESDEVIYLPKEVAEAAEYIRNLCGSMYAVFEEFYNSLPATPQGRIIRNFGHEKKSNRDLLIRALVKGYKIAYTPEEILQEHIDKLQAIVADETLEYATRKKANGQILGVLDAVRLLKLDMNLKVGGKE